MSCWIDGESKKKKKMNVALFKKVRKRCGKPMKCRLKFDKLLDLYVPVSLRVVC